jgi:hypothetical protein
VPAPLNLNPSRARRQFAARLAQRRKEQEAAAAAAAAATHTTVHEDDDDDDDEDDDGPEDIEDVERLVDVEVDDFFGSDDSLEGEEAGISMKKAERTESTGEGQHTTTTLPDRTREREILD